MTIKNLFGIILIFGISLGLSACQNSPDTMPEDTRLITDMAGREVAIPLEIDKSFSLSSGGTIFLYTLNPELLVGYNYDFSEQEAAFILPEYLDLPIYGQSNSLNAEAIILAAPDILISYGYTDEAAIEQVEDIEKQTGIPCLMFDSTFNQTAAAYQLAGEVFGLSERGQALADYAQNVDDFIQQIAIAEQDRATIYYGNGRENLETAPSGSPHAELLELVQANNVAKIEGDFTARMDISSEQIIGWNPDFIILNGEPSEGLSASDASQQFLANPDYQQVAAIVNQQVYPIPKYPFSWFDRPSAPNRLIGVYWLSELLYPDLYDIDIEQEAQDFYQLFYHWQLTEQEIDQLLGK